MSDEIKGGTLEIPMTIPELIQVRERIIESWKVASEALRGVNSAFDGIRGITFRMVDPQKKTQQGGYLCDYHEYRHGDDKNYPHDIERQTKALDFSLWVFALERLDITNVMTAKAKQDFLEKVRKAGEPFTAANVEGLAQNAVRIFQDSTMNMVRETYRTLIGCWYNGGTWGSGKKDNLQKVEKVFRCGGSDFMVKGAFGYGGESIKWNDVLTACRLIEGRGVTNYSNNFYSYVHAPDRTLNEVETEYFHLQAYHNGNVKCRWKEDKIHVLEKFNAIGSGRENAMPDVMRKRYKGEHFENGGMPKAEDYFKPTGKEPNSDKDFAFFPTPPEVAKRMWELLEIPNSLPEEHSSDILFVLEPSAGDGGLVGVYDKPDFVHINMFEFNHHRAKILEEKFPVPDLYTTHEQDFLLEGTYSEDSPGSGYDRVIMNPPFNDRVEAVHVVHAFKSLVPGGILVAIIPEGWFYRDDLKSRVFREFLERNEYKPSERLPKGTFSKTAVETRIICLRRKA